MTELLRKAIARVGALPEEHQDFYAQALLDEMESERKWDELFARPIDGTKLEQLIQEAEDDIRAGRDVSVDEWLTECRANKRRNDESAQTQRHAS